MYFINLSIKKVYHTSNKTTIRLLKSSNINGINIQQRNFNNKN